MATIKLYTDIEQSKKLADILPIERADMYYPYYHNPISGKSYYEEYPIFHIPMNKSKSLPCWSLASLLDVLPNNENITTNLSRGGYRISTLEYTNSWFLDYEDETNGLNNCVTSADNPVDACVAMIERLHELNLLQP